MTLAVPKKKWELFHSLMESRGVESTIIGEFTNSGHAVVTYKGKTVLDIELEFLHNGLPKRDQIASRMTKKINSPKTPSGTTRTKIFEDLIGVNNIGGLAFISEQYDHEVQSSSVLKPLTGRGLINTDAQVIRPVFGSTRGVVLSSALYPSYGDINAYDMSAGAIDTAIRNSISAGGSLSHLAILDNFCWCSSSDVARLSELVDSARACYDAATYFGTPFISGKDSMFNDFDGYNEKGEKTKISVPPTLLISTIGVMPDVYKATSPEFKAPGDIIYLIGQTKNELGASEYYKLLAKNEASGNIGGNVPKVDLKTNYSTYSALEEAIKEDLVASAISLSSGGLATALAKACIGGMLGATINITPLPDSLGLDAKLFSESQGRILVSVGPKRVSKFEKAMRGISLTKLGVVGDNGAVTVINHGKKIIDTNINKIHKIYHQFSNKMR